MATSATSQMRARSGPGRPAKPPSTAPRPRRKAFGKPAEAHGAPRSPGPGGDAEEAREGHKDFRCYEGRSKSPSQESTGKAGGPARQGRRGGRETPPHPAEGRGSAADCSLNRAGPSGPTACSSLWGASPAGQHHDPRRSAVPAAERRLPTAGAAESASWGAERCAERGAQSPR